jgi:hypothetical protein
MASSSRVEAIAGPAAAPAIVVDSSRKELVRPAAGTGPLWPFETEQVRGEVNI